MPENEQTSKELKKIKLYIKNASLLSALTYCAVIVLVLFNWNTNMQIVFATTSILSMMIACVFAIIGYFEEREINNG